MELDLAEDPRIADEDEEEAESAEVYVEHLELREVEERLSRRPALPPLPPLPRRRTSGPAAAEVERQLNQILKGICVKGHFSVQSSNERSDTVARASLVVEEGPSELLNRVVRVYSLKDRNRAKQGDHVWVELRSCVLDRAALERGGPKTRWTMSEALSYVCIFGAVLRASTPAGVAAQRSCYLCKQSQMQWKPGVLNFIPFSHEVPILQVMVEGEDREQPLDEVFQLMMVDWPVNRLRPLAVIMEKLPVPRPLSLERSLEIFLKDLDFLQDPEDPKVQEMADEAVDLMTPEEELELVDASRRELDGQIFSIDAAGASIIDDALEYDLEEQVVRVHIADVAALVCSGGDLDLHAARRGCSVFIRDHHEELQRCEPMLPACVTFQTSLEKNQWRRALTFEFRVGEQLQFRGFFRSWVRSKEQLSFQDAEGLMGGMEAQGTTPGTSGVRRSLRALWQWTRAELEKRKAQGRAALQAFLSTASSRNSQEGHAESLVEFWMRQVNEESGGILAQQSAISYCFPCPDAHHFSRLAILCREALLRAGHAAQDELLLKLRSSPEECQESLADILSHVTRLTGRTAQRPNRWRSTARAATGEVTQGVSVLCQQLSQCVPIAQYRMKPSGETQWPILQQSQHYFQVTSPMRRWIDLLGQHLLLGTCQLDFEEMAQYVESFNEMSLLAKQTSSRFAFLSFCRELQQSERQMECMVTRIDQGTLHLACPDMAGFHGQMVLPLQLLSSHDLQVRPIIEEKKAIVTRVDDAKQLELRPFHSKMQVQLSLDQSSPVSLYRLCASALFLDFRDGSRAFRHAVLARQHPEVFGLVPDLRKAREMHRAGGLWGSTWQQVRQAQMCAAALMPQMRAKAPYHMTASYEELENFCFVGNRSEGYEVYVTVPSSYRGLRGLNKLQVGHLALLWRSDRGKLWMCCGAVKAIDITEQMKRKTELCTRFARNGTCEYEDCWYAHGSDELIPERAKVTLRLSDCSARLLPAWAASHSGALDVDFAAISSREQLALKSIREVERTSRQPQQLVNRLVFRGRGGPGGWHAPAIADEAPIDTPAGLPPLNNYQQKALQLTLKEVLAYVQGPPGTGKSTTAAHLICQLLLRPPQRGAMVKPLLVCCPSNKACDRLLHLFLKAEMSRDIWVVRVYAKTIEQNYWRDPRSQCCRDYEIDPDLLQYALHQQVEDQDPSFKQQYLDIAQELEDYCTKPGELLKVQKTLTEAKQTKELKSKEILKQAQVIFTTCDCACNDRLFQRMTFPSVIIDEAAQALEPELARCCLLAEDHLALFGDHEQLGPVLTEQTLFPAFKNMWTQSLFERIVSKRPGRQSNSPTTGIPHVTLKRQYRMHPSISCFANEEFYQCQLVDDEEAYRDGFTLPSEFNSRMSVIDVTGAHGRKSVAPEGDAVQDFETSLCNPSEAAVVKAYVTWLVALGVRVGEIGVVTPYRAQAALIKEVLTEALSNVSELPSIGTVHLLQGEERQYVILSLVRSFAEADTEVFDPVPQDARRRKVYSLGFLNDRRLANVALTRAQLGLVVVANTQVLSSASHWKNLFEHARNNRCYWDQDAAMDFFQSGEAPAATSDSYWAEVRSQSPLASGSESEGHAEASASEASEASEASAFGSAPSSAASLAEAAPEAPPVSAPAPVPVARRRRAKRSKAKAKAKAASQARRAREADDAEILEEALAEPSAPLSPATERERRAPAVCCVAECRIRPHQRSPFASAHGLCSAHWIELLKETNVLEQMDVDGLSPHSLQWPVSSMERFILPTYWKPLPPIVGDLGLRSRSFFSVLLRYLETKMQTSPSLDVLFTLAFTESIRSAKQLQMSPEDFLHTAAIGLLLALQAIEDCAGEVPSQFQERWQQLSGRRQSQQSYQEDLLAIATFWKEEGNRHKQKRHLPGEFQLALDSYALGSELLEELPVSPPVARVAADLANNASAAFIDVEDYPNAEQSASSAISFFEKLTDESSLPKKAKAFYRRGVALHRLGRLQESVTDLTCALRICPEDEIRNRLVIVQGELERAEQLHLSEGDW